MCVDYGKSFRCLWTQSCSTAARSLLGILPTRLYYKWKERQHSLSTFVNQRTLVCVAWSCASLRPVENVALEASGVWRSSGAHASSKRAIEPTGNLHRFPISRWFPCPVFPFPARPRQSDAWKKWNSSDFLLPLVVSQMRWTWISDLQRWFWNKLSCIPCAFSFKKIDSNSTANKFIKCHWNGTKLLFASMRAYFNAYNELKYIFIQKWT